MINISSKEEEIMINISNISSKGAETMRNISTEEEESIINFNRE